MATRVKFDVDPEYVKPKLEDLDIQTVSYADYVGLGQGISQAAPNENSNEDSSRDSSPRSRSVKGYSWYAWGLDLSLGDIGEVASFVKNFLKEIDRIQRAIVAILSIIRIFTSDLKSIARALKFVIRQIVKAIRELVDSLSSTGIYMSVIFPPFDARDSKYVMPINGGFSEFISNVNQRCLDSNDPDAPRFQDADVVGGYIVGMIGGTNDPKFLEDMIHNFGVLAQLFPIKAPVPAPVRGLTAISGFYKDENGDLKMGVEIKWESPGSPVSGYNLYRSKRPKGVQISTEDDKGNTVNVEVFQDSDFNGGEPVELSHIPFKGSYKYVDFEVEGGQTYYYKVFTTVGYDFIKINFFKRVESPNASATVHATPQNCIPTSELKKYLTLDTRGQTVRPEEFGGDWQSFNIRSLLGQSIDSLFDLLDRVALKLEGYIDTSTDFMDKYLKYLEKKIKFFIDILDQIEEIITRLSALRLRGTFLVLELYPEAGGMQHFVDRFNDAASFGEVEDTNLKKKEKSKEDEDLNKSKVPEGIRNYMESGIMSGIIIVYGFPHSTGAYIKEFVDDTQIDSYTADLEKSKKAIEYFMKLVGLNG